MKKIPTLFARDFDNDPRYVTRKVTPGCEWVLAGEGIPTRKFDGTCVMFDGEKWWARREVKKDKSAPAGFVEVERDETTGKTVGWEPAEQSAFWKWLAEALDVKPVDPQPPLGPWPAGTYELIGPKVNGNPEHFDQHAVIFHAFADQFGRAPRTYDGLAVWLLSHPYEGIVWHHEDGRMAKLKARDFPRP